jgi:hypothetical protein
MVQQWIVDQDIDDIISDNRLGVLSKKCLLFFTTHQLNVMTGTTTMANIKIHQNIIKW